MPDPAMRIGHPPSRRQPVKVLIATNDALPYEFNKYAIDRLIESLQRVGYRVTVVKTSGFQPGVGRNGKATMLLDGHPAPWFDVVLPMWGVHTAPDDLLLVDFFRARGALVLNSNLAARCKGHAIVQLSQAGLPVVPSQIVRRHVDYSDLRRKLGRPFVIKPTIGTNGSMTRLISRPKDFIRFWRDFSEPIALAQPFIASTFGKQSADIRVLVIDGEAVDPAIRRIAPAGEFRANVKLGAMPQATRLTDSLRQLAEGAAAAVRADMVGVDVLTPDEEGAAYLLTGDINLSPGFLGYERAAPQVSIADLVVEMIERRLGLQRPRQAA